MVQARDESNDFCPPIDWALITDEELAQVEGLLANGILTENEIINKYTPIAPVIEISSEPQNPLEVINNALQNIIPGLDPKEEIIIEEFETPTETEEIVEEPAVIDESADSAQDALEVAESEPAEEPATELEPQMELEVKIDEPVNVPNEPIMEAPAPVEDNPIE